MGFLEDLAPQTFTSDTADLLLASRAGTTLLIVSMTPKYMNLQGHAINDN